MSELAEGARLEIVCAAKSGTEGSNPSLSATLFPYPKMLTDVSKTEFDGGLQHREVFPCHILF